MQCAYLSIISIYHVIYFDDALHVLECTKGVEYVHVGL